MNTTAIQKTLFLDHLATCCHVGQSCEKAGVNRKTAYAWRKGDEEFAAAWEQAMKDGFIALEDEMHRRGYQGVDKPVFHNGAEVATVKDYSDTLAIFLAKAHNPEKYRERTDVNITGRLDIAEAIVSGRKRLGEG
jgi:hypothetical protein